MAFKTIASKVVSGANAATALTASRTPAHVVYVYAFAANGAVVWVGDANVSSTASSEQGVALAAGATQQFTSEIAPNDLDLSKIFIASTSSTAKVGIAYIEG